MPKSKVYNKPSGPQPCKGCGQSFPSRNSIFKHLRDTDGACLTGKDFEEFCKFVRSDDKGKKFLILYGYLPCPGRVKNGEDAGQILMQAVEQWQRQIDGNTDEPSEDSIKFNRSYGNTQRRLDSVAQDDGTGAISEGLITRLQPLRGGRTVEQWLDQVQDILNEQFPSLSPVPIRILGRQEITPPKFNAEMDVSRRRIEYILPVEFLSWSNDEFKTSLETLPTFSSNNKIDVDRSFTAGALPELKITKYLHGLKKVMQMLTTQIVQIDINDKAAILEKGFSLQKRKGKARKANNKKKKSNDGCAKDETVDVDEKTEEEMAASLVNVDKHRKLRRKRFHNFTPKLMAHENLAYRRLDRMYHRATLSFPSVDPLSKPFLVLSVSADLFLTGQVARVVGLFLALANGWIDTDFVDCVFDEDYPHLIPTPPAPLMGMVAAEANYMTWEGKVKAILSPRNTDRFEQGFNQLTTLQRVKEWQETVYEDVAKQWLSPGRDETTGRLVAEMEWTENILKPWAEKAKQQLEDYRKWVQVQTLSKQPDNSNGPTTESAENGAVNGEGNATPDASLVPPLESVDSTVPEMFEQVLYHLRQLDASGEWPTTSLKRQLVMITTEENEDGKESAATSLSISHMKAKKNKETRSSAYAFAEGQGGASGSFSVGLMPGGGINKQPKSNSLFPGLVKAAFELERNLCPDREPSSTIAINRNAQFRPHTDSGAGAGQSTSLIVGFGTYSGGELMVEGEMRDIRYKAIEFNGWKERHWTMPFGGERYSLVWFTPKGCEGMRGIDLDLTEIPNAQSTSLDGAATSIEE
jgi:tRNA U38,U39,U40 pseudouridine synthase TruA